MLGGGDRPVDPRIALSLPSDHSIYEVRKSFLTIVTLTLLVTPVSPSHAGLPNTHWLCDLRWRNQWCPKGSWYGATC